MRTLFTSFHLLYITVPKMYEALKAGGPTPFKRYPTIATGLSPPTAGMYIILHLFFISGL